MSTICRGLRNPDTHGTTSDGEPYCESCGVCDEGWRCRCCLAAEVEALRARNETLIATIQRQDSTFERQMEEHEELEALRAQVQRVRDVTVPVPGDVYDLDSYTRGAADALALTNKALDGGSSTVLPPLPSTPLDQNPVCPACGGTLALERNRVVCLSDEVNHYWYWDGSDD